MSHLVGFLFLMVLQLTSSYRILAVLPTPSYSHQITFRPVMDKLAENGHEVVVLTPYPSANPNLTEIDLRFLKETWRKIDFDMVGQFKYYEFIKTLVNVQVSMMDQILSHAEVQKLIHGNYHFDAVICEFIGYTPMYALARFYKAPLIGITSLDMFPEQHAGIGNFVHMTLHPNSAFPFYGKLSFFERVGAVFIQQFMYNSFVGFYFSQLDTVIVKHFGPIATSAELSNDVTFAITNAHPALDNVRPLLPSTIQVGFLHIKPPKPLAEEFNRILDRPTIYLSFGSNVQSSNLKPQIMKTILTVFKDLKEYNIIWKWEGDNVFTDIPNLYVFKWLPQQDLLAHKNVKLFIFQAGLQSMEEAIDRGVPMLAIPFWADQVTNAPKIQHLGIGLYIKRNHLNVPDLKDTIMELINNSR